MNHLKTLFLTTMLLSMSAGLRAEEPPKAYHEISPLFVNQTGDLSRASAHGGLSYTYHFNGLIWLGVDASVGPYKLDADLSSSVQKGDLFKLFLGTFYYNLPSLLGRSSINIPAELYTSLSLGAAMIGDETSPAGSVGGGILIQWPLDWLYLRFDFKGLFYSVENPGGRNFSADTLLSLGPSFVF